jgi:uncharacterized protein (DUF2164 family)
MSREVIKLTKEKRDEMVSIIKDFFYKEREEKLGDLASNLILDFFIEELAPEFYNQGVNDSYTYMSDRLEDLLSIQHYPRR